MIKIGMTIYESGGLVGDTESLIVTKENIRLVKSFWGKGFFPTFDEAEQYTQKAHADFEEHMYNFYSY
jgi:hypothetical protein